MITRLYCTIIKLAVHKEKQWLGDLVSLQAYTVSRGWWGGGFQPPGSLLSLIQKLIIVKL